MALLCLVVAVIAAVPTLRRERLQLVILKNLIEEAAAPEEPILVDNWLLYRLLRWKASPAIRDQLALDPQSNQLPVTLQHPQEILVVCTSGSSLLPKLRSHGYTLTPDAAQTRWIDSGSAFRIPGRSPFLIQFASPAAQPPVSSQQP